MILITCISYDIYSHKNKSSLKELDPRTIKMCPTFFSKFNLKIIKPCNTLYYSTQYPALMYVFFCSRALHLSAHAQFQRC